MCIQVDQPEPAPIHQSIPSTPQKPNPETPAKPSAQNVSSPAAPAQNKNRISELSETLVPPAIEESENLSDRVDSDLSDNQISESM